MTDVARCALCGEPMPPGEEMFKYHGYSDDCPKPPLPRVPDVLKEVAAERARQDAKWGGPAHDDQHSVAEFVQWIEDYAGWARMMASMNSYDKARDRLVQVAALAVAAVETLDRRAMRGIQHAAEEQR